MELEMLKLFVASFCLYLSGLNKASQQQMYLEKQEEIFLPFTCEEINICASSE